MRVVFAVVLVLALVAGGVAIYSILGPDIAAMSEGSTAVTDADQVNEMVTVFVRNPYQDDYGVVRLPGYVENKSDKSLAAVEMDIQLTDGEGNNKELFSYKVEDVPAGARKSFDANAGPISDDRMAEVTVTAVHVSD